MEKRRAFPLLYTTETVFLSALPGPDSHTAKTEDWTSMTSMTSMSSMRSFPSGMNGADRSCKEPDLKYPQQVNKTGVNMFMVPRWWHLKTFLRLVLSLRPVCPVMSQPVHTLHQTSMPCMEIEQPTAWTLVTTGSPSRPVWLPVWVRLVPALQLHWKLHISTQLLNSHKQTVRLNETHKHSPEHWMWISPPLKIVPVKLELNVF